MIKIGVRAHDFGRMEPQVLAHTIKKAGFSCAQLAVTKAIQGIQRFEDITPRHMFQIKEAFDAADVEITVLGCYIEPSISNKEQRLHNVALFQQSLQYASALQIPFIGTETTHFSGNEAEREIAYECLLDSVLRMVETAEKENVFVGIEPVAEHTLNTPALTKRLIEDVGSDKLQIIFDPVNLLLPNTVDQQKEIYTQLFQLVGDRISVMHIKDITIQQNEKTWCNIGAGLVNYPFIINWLKLHKPNIRLLREGIAMDSYEKDYKAMNEWVNSDTLYTES